MTRAYGFISYDCPINNYGHSSLNEDSGVEIFENKISGDIIIRFRCVSCHELHELDLKEMCLLDEDEK
jgi:hypothetical protein